MRTPNRFDPSNATMNEFAILVFLLCVSTGSVAGQIPAGSRPAAAEVPSFPATIKVRVDLTNIVMTVTDQQNHPVLGLSENDFRVFEDNQPQTIRNFSSESSLPLRCQMEPETNRSQTRRYVVCLARQRGQKGVSGQHGHELESRYRCLGDCD